MNSAAGELRLADSLPGNLRQGLAARETPAVREGLGASVERASDDERSDASVTCEHVASSGAWAAIRCPACLGRAEHRSAGLRCLACGVLTPIEQGVLRCVNSDDAFYEEAYLNEVRHLPGKSRAKDWVFFSLLQSGVFGKVRSVLGQDAVVADIGCASGIRWLERYHTIGVDLSFGSVRKTRDFYEVSIQARAERLPLAAESVDVVYSSYFFEHVPRESKDAVIKELVRVMRPGAHLVLLFDVLSDGPFGRYARRDPKAFERGFVAGDGHVGLELLSSALQRMERAGLTLQHVSKFGATPVQYMSSYRWLDIAYGDTTPWVRKLGALAARVAESRLRLPVELGITAFDTLLNRYTIPDHATRAIVVARK